MTYREYKDKVRACWLGKNIGGTLGAPFESYRCAVDLDYYTHDVEHKGVLPNDDLDLQLIWLNAAETYTTALNSEILSTYWITDIPAYWSEYGAGMNNLDFGILPPASGRYKNPFGESCGCFIRSEIWACLMPGRPDLAVKYAYEDACVDHFGEGIYAEIFCTALQSAAFTESDPDTLIDIALSYIPSDCAVANAITVVRRAYEDGVDWKEARRRVLTAVPDTFGLRYSENEADLPIGKLGFDAPANIGLMILGWLFGENDFSRSVCIAAGCGEDADCTAGTLGATFGILNGTAGIDEKWTAPIGDEIKTVAINRADLKLRIPETVTELTERVAALMPSFMRTHLTISEDGQLSFKPSGSMKKPLWSEGWMTRSDPYWYMYRKDLLAKKENSLFTLFVIADSPEITDGAETTLRLRFENRAARHLWVNIHIDLPSDWGEHRAVNQVCWLNEWSSGSQFTDTTVTIPAAALVSERCELHLMVTANGFPSRMHIPLVFLRA